MRTLGPFLKKKRIQADAWDYHPSQEVSRIFGPLVVWSGTWTDTCFVRGLAVLAERVLVDGVCEVFRGYGVPRAGGDGKSFSFDELGAESGSEGAPCCWAGEPWMSG